MRSRGGGWGEADITGVTKSTAPGAELYGGTSGILNQACREEVRKESGFTSCLYMTVCGWIEASATTRKRQLDSKKK